MKHRFASGKPDGADGTLVQASNWNEPHGFGTTALSADTTLDNTHDAILATGGGSGITLTLPTAASITGRSYTVIKVDSGAGAVTLDGNGTELINGSQTLVLSAQYSGVQIVSNGTKWLTATSTSTSPTTLYLADSGAVIWATTVSDGGILSTVVSSGAGQSIFLSPNSTVSYQLSVTTGGVLTTTSVTYSSSYPQSIFMWSGGGIAWLLYATPAGVLRTYSFLPVPSWKQVEVDTGSIPMSRGSFTISDSDIASTSWVLIQQASAAYTNKGTLTDEAEMDPLWVSAFPSAGSAAVTWSTIEDVVGLPGVIIGYIKFNYEVLQ